MDELVARVTASRKYRNLDPALVRRIAAEEAAKPGDRVKAVRTRLHQAVCAYQVGEPRYDRWLAALSSAPDLKPVCLDIMRSHASTRERLPILDRFYAEAMPPNATSVVDVGCGLNPLAIPWMHLAPNARYHAYDVDADLIAFLNEALPLLGVDGRAELLDAAATPEQIEPGADVALVLKLLPLLPDDGASLLATLTARTLVVSFPTRTIGGARKGFARTYEERYAAVLRGRKIELPGELAFVVDTGAVR
jgi:16S rRNA (guanine(1405)-N(7))-methyltransferase